MNKLNAKNVAEKLGIQYYQGTKYHCFQKENHKNKDNNPSLSIFENNAGEICFKCHGCSIAGNLFELVKLRYNIGFEEARNWIEKEFGEYKYPAISSHLKNISGNYELLKFVERNKEYSYLERDQHDYFKNFGIKEFLLNKNNVYSLMSIKFLNNNKEIKFNSNNPGYLYQLEKDSFKVYQPRAREKKNKFYRIGSLPIVPPAFGLSSIILNMIH